MFLNGMSRTIAVAIAAKAFSTLNNPGIVSNISSSNLDVLTLKEIDV